MADIDPNDPTILVARLSGLRDTLRQLVAELHIVAERAEMFAGKKRPRQSGSPQLEKHREYLARLCEQARCAIGRRRGPNAEALYFLLNATGERPPSPVVGASYTYQAVLIVAQAVRNIAWNDGPAYLRGARDPWHRRTPAQRLVDPNDWVWEGVPLPYFGDRSVYAEFNAALAREFDCAERLVGGQHLRCQPDHTRESAEVPPLNLGRRAEPRVSLRSERSARTMRSDLPPSFPAEGCFKFGPFDLTRLSPLRWRLLRSLWDDSADRPLVEGRQIAEVFLGVYAEGALEGATGSNEYNPTHHGQKLNNLRNKLNEVLADVAPAGWVAEVEPVGRSHSRLRLVIQGPEDLAEDF